MNKDIERYYDTEDSTNIETYFSKDPAGFWIRFLASIVDSLLLGLTLGFISFLVFNQSYLNMEDLTFFDLIDSLYYLLLPIFWYGYTVGKRAVGIRIARMDGKKVGIGTMLMRNVVAGLVYLLTLGIGIIVSAFMVGLREDKRAIHDFIAGTYVTYNRPGE